MDIRDTDLQYLPFKIAKWKCLIPGCKSHGRIVKDYGIPPFYFWPVKQRLYKDGWRGGWFDASLHWVLCNKHLAEHEKLGHEAFNDKYRVYDLDDPGYRSFLVVTSEKKSKRKAY